MVQCRPPRANMVNGTSLVVRQQPRRTTTYSSPKYIPAGIRGKWRDAVARARDDVYVLPVRYSSTRFHSWCEDVFIQSDDARRPATRLARHDRGDRLLQYGCSEHLRIWLDVRQPYLVATKRPCKNGITGVFTGGLRVPHRVLELQCSEPAGTGASRSGSALVATMGRERVGRRHRSRCGHVT